MAIFRSPLGQFKNRLGNMVTCTIEGDTIARSLPLNVKNPRTPKQVAQRIRFSTLTITAKQLRRICEFGFTSGGKRQTGMNRFVQRNKDVVSVDEFGTATIAYEQMAVSAGSLISYEVSGTWDPETQLLNVVQAVPDYTLESAEKEFIVYAVLLETQRMEYLLVPLKKWGEGGETQITLPPAWSRDVTHLYSVVHDEVTGRNSDSEHCALN